MPDLRSSRFTRTGSVFSRLRDQPPRDPTHHRSEPDAPPLASADLCSQDPPTNEPQWAFADGHRRYPAIGAMESLELGREAPWSLTNAHPSVRPDLGTAGPDDEPCDDGDDDDETQANLIGSKAPARVDLPCDPLRSDHFTPWPIETPDDALDTFELLRSPSFDSGLVVLVLDDHRIPFLHVALRGNPEHDVQRALRLFCPSLPNGRIPSGLILGVVRNQHRQPPQSVFDSSKLGPSPDSGEEFGEPSIWVDPVESAEWRIAAWNLHDEGIKLHDVIVIEPDRWMSLAHAAGLIAYDTVQYA